MQKEADVCFATERVPDPLSREKLNRRPVCFQPGRRCPPSVCRPFWRMGRCFASKRARATKETRGVASDEEQAVCRRSGYRTLPGVAAVQRCRGAVVAVSTGWLTPEAGPAISAPGTGTIIPGTTAEPQHDGVPGERGDPGERIEHARAFGIHCWPASPVKVGPQ